MTRTDRGAARLHRAAERDEQITHAAGETLCQMEAHAAHGGRSR